MTPKEYIYQNIIDMGGKIVVSELLSKLNDYTVFNQLSIYNHLSRLKREGKLYVHHLQCDWKTVYCVATKHEEKSRIYHENTYYNHISKVDVELWHRIVFLIFKKKLTIKEISWLLNVKVSVVDYIFFAETENLRLIHQNNTL